MNKKHVLLLLIAASAVALLYAISSKSQTKPKNVPTEQTLEQSVVQQLSKKYAREENSVSITVNSQTGGHAKGTVQFGDEPGGGLWFAAKTDTGWKVAFDGNGIVTCEDIEKYEFPREMIPSCVSGEELIER